MGFLNYMRDIYVSPKSPSNPQKLAQSTMHQMQTTLNTILNKAVRNGLISANPFASLDKRERVSKAESNIVALTKDEVRHWLPLKQAVLQPNNVIYSVALQV